MTRIIIATAPLLLAVACGLPPADSESWAEVSAGVAEHIWQLEEAYNNGYLAADHPAILELLDDGFLGWPGGEPVPADREAMAHYLERRYARPGTWTITVERQGIEVQRDVAVNHYTVHSRWIDAAGVERMRSSKVTHTWVREGAAWRILGGMSAPLDR
jgi:hypothetical protein